MYAGDLLLVFAFIAIIHFDKWQIDKAKCPDYCDIEHICNKESNDDTR